MIKTRKQLKEAINIERKLYLGSDKKKYLETVLMKEPSVRIFKYLVYLRKMEYYHSNCGVFQKLGYAYFRRKKNILGERLGIEMWDLSFEPGLKIDHASGIVVNGYARIGKNCRLHGKNCIGNNGLNYTAPKIGNNVDLGVGASVIGDVELADNIIVAAGAVVVKSCFTEGAVLAGVPAKVIKVRNDV